MRMLSLLLGSLLIAGLAGCSYHPARISPEPAIVIDDDGRYHDRDRDWDRDWDRDHRHRDHDRWKRDRDYRHHDHDRDRGRFCPPGQAKKGRC
ncbi:hypothetical protein [Halomonas elongata]|uniref:hypothetical protein n=1 Tax=Halomonas elongata TaxID=2746 RepID=UPI0023B0AAF2|nr:hypothetical protein [Halomonas elongata]